MTKVLALVLLSACTEPPPLEPEGPHYQYVVSALHVAGTNTEAREFGSDLNGDRVVDNQLGMVFATLQSMGLGVGDTADEALLRGGLVMLADFQTLAFDTTEASAVRTYLGHSPAPAPCIDPADLTTCGQHLRGTGQFLVQEGTSSDLGIAPIIDGRFSATVDQLAVQVAIADPEDPFALDLHGARMRMSSISPAGANAAIGGAITRADIENVIIPVAAAQIDRIAVRDCTRVDLTCNCVPDSNGKTLLGFFDIDPRDCRVSVEEIAENSLVDSLLSPDVTIDGEPMLSFGLAVELASATFLEP